MGKLAGKVAIITGGNSGIGLATAVEFVAECAQVVITGRRQEAIDGALAEIGPSAIGIQGDVSNLRDMEHLVARVIERFGRIDIIVANAGFLILAPIGEVSEENYDIQFDITKGHFFLVQYALPHLAPGSSVIFVSSVAGSRAVDGHNVYGGSKAALRAFARSCAHDLKGRDIRFNVLTPGPVETPIFGKLGYDDDQLANFRKRVAVTTPLGRPGDPSELAKAALFLASDDSSFVTGTELFVDGGRGQI